jgi:DNA (cytosine-5)-methyltransferase 1
MGYKTRALSLSAKDMGADHIRSRYWLFAYTDDASKFLRTFNAEMEFLPRMVPDVWSDYTAELRVADGVAYRLDRLKAIGNGQVPQCAAAAWRMLTGDM